MERKEIAGLSFISATLNEAVDEALRLILTGKGGMVVTPNAEIGKLAIDDPDFRALLSSADLVVPDGAGVVLAGKLLGAGLKGKIAGIDLGLALLPRLAEHDLPLFLLGSKPGVADTAAEKLCGQVPGLTICGTQHGYFKEDEEIVARIRESGAKALFCCLGAPKQEQWMNAHRAELPGVLMLGLGGTLDVVAGNVKRAPDFFIKCNLEWFYRLLKEPRRIGRMMKLPAYELDVLLLKLGLKKLKGREG